MEKHMRLSADGSEKDGMDRQRERQKVLIARLKEQLEDLEKYAYEAGEGGLPSTEVMARQVCVSLFFRPSHKQMAIKFCSNQFAFHVCCCRALITFVNIKLFQKAVIDKLHEKVQLDLELDKMSQSDLQKKVDEALKKVVFEMNLEVFKITWRPEMLPFFSFFMEA